MGVPTHAEDGCQFSGRRRDRWFTAGEAYRCRGERDVALVVHQREQRFCFLQASLPQTQIGETAQGLQTRPGAVEGIAATAAKM